MCTILKLFFITAFFAHRFYWFVNAGALVAYVGIAAVQQNVSFAWGYFIPFCTMILAIFFLLIARGKYRYRTKQGDCLLVCFSCKIRSKQERVFLLILF
jgi:peptide/histidine transporter 3/4